MENDVFTLTVDVEPVVQVFADDPAPVQESSLAETTDDGATQQVTAVGLPEQPEECADAFVLPSDVQIMQAMVSEDYSGAVQIGDHEFLHTGSLTPGEVIDAINALGGLNGLAAQADNFDGNIGIDHAGSGFSHTDGYIITAG